MNDSMRTLAKKIIYNGLESSSSYESENENFKIDENILEINENSISDFNPPNVSPSLENLANQEEFIENPIKRLLFLWDKIYPDSKFNKKKKN